MTKYIALFILALSSSAYADWSCTATCKVMRGEVLDSILYSASGAQFSDFDANCSQALHGHRESSDPGRCGGVAEFCMNYVSTEEPLSADGATLTEARQSIRQQCVSGNQQGNFCGGSYQINQVVDSSFNCKQN